MSELMNARANGQDFRWRLLTTVSALALLASVYGGQTASASDDDTDRPVVWIELGGQLERLNGSQTPFAPPFFDAVTKGGLESPLEAGKPSIYSYGGEETISFMPEGSDWVFSGSVRYGRSNGDRFLHQQPKPPTPHFTFFGHPYTNTAVPANYEETKAGNSETHLIADFQAGKDVGLGLFGGESMSTFSAGIRFAQFSAKSDVTIHARPDVHIVTIEFLGFQLPQVGYYHEYFGSAQRAASFKGVGPSISWNGSAPLRGNPRDVEIALDWGANAAVLFGRQTAQVHHHTTAQYHGTKYTAYHPRVMAYQPRTSDHVRSRSVVVPNVGGFAGLSFRYADAKVSFGYRADFFFGAMDGGLDAHKSYNQGFYGPFASISVGIGG